jgi:hypothetical protein
MPKKFFPIILVAFVLGTMACSLGTILTSPSQKIQGSGKLASESRNVSGFTSINLQGSANVNVTFDGTESAVVEADDNILPFIETRVQNGQLVIATKPNVSFTTNNPVRVNVTMKSLDSLTLSGSGNIFVSGLSGDAIKISLPGSGNITVAGSANSVAITLGGSGMVTCKDLQAHTVNVNLSGSGNVSVFASESLDATIRGSGNIQYGGNPAKVNKSIPGSGNINPLP